MVALAVVSIGLLAISKALSHSIDVAQQLESRTIANWVASNRMAELRMNRIFTAAGSTIQEQTMAGRNWKIIDTYFGTQDPNISRVTVEVFEDESEQKIYSVVGFLARYKPAKLQ